MLAIPGAIMAGVEFGPEGIVAALRPASGRLTCPCGWSTAATYAARSGAGATWTWVHPLVARSGDPVEVGHNLEAVIRNA